MKTNKQPAKPSEVRTMLEGAQILDVWMDGTDEKGVYPFEAQLKVRQQNGDIKTVHFGSDEGGETTMTEAERDWNHFYMSITTDDSTDLNDLPVFQLKPKRELCYKLGNVLASTAIRYRERAKALLECADACDELKMDCFRVGREIHQEIVSRRIDG